MKKRLLSIVFALLILCQLLSFSILATTPSYDDDNETPGIGWENPVYYTVTLPTDPVGYTITAGDTEVMAGESFSFTVEVLKGYKKSDNFAVLANGETLTATEGVCTITVTGDVTITVEGVEAEATDLPIVGDVTNDGYVNVNDAMTLYRYAAKKPNVVIYGTNGDVTGDGYVNVNDAMTLYRYAAKKPNVTIVWGVLTPLA